MQGAGKSHDWRSGTFEHSARGHPTGVGDPPDNPFRVKERDFVGPPITPSQQKVLTALVNLCPDDGNDATARQVADEAYIRLGSVVVVLRSLVKRRLALLHEDTEDHWSPTMSGRARIRHSRAAEGRASNGPDDPPPPPDEPQK